MIDPTLPISDWLPTLWYGGYLPDLPDLCVGQLPAGVSRASPWKIWIVETSQERSNLLAALAAPAPRVGAAIDLRSGPDAAVSAQGRGAPFVALFSPSKTGWPWITVARVPVAVGRIVGAARGVYTTEVDATEKSAMDRMERLAMLSGNPRILYPPPAHSQN